jgi:hypothetical protein
MIGYARRARAPAQATMAAHRPTMTTGNDATTWAIDRQPATSVRPAPSHEKKPGDRGRRRPGVGTCSSSSLPATRRCSPAHSRAARTVSASRGIPMSVMESSRLT